MDYLELVRIVEQKQTLVTMTEDQIIAALQEVEQVIKNYCAIPQVPVALKYTWSNMAIDLLLYQAAANADPESDDSGLDNLEMADVQSLKIGDTTVTLGAKSSTNQRGAALKSHVAILDDIVLNYRAQLNQFRRLW